MIRTFHPIGQGAFYTEEFGAFSVVYDCGTDSKKSFLKAEIENVFEKGQIIDAVFISHLHEDHVNGLKYLMEFCRVQRLFLPLLTEQEKIHLIISNYVNGDPDPFTEELINYSANHNNEKKPERLRNAKVVFVKPLRDNNNDIYYKKLKPIFDLVYYSIKSDDERLEKEVFSFLVDFVIKYREGNPKEEIVFPEDFYTMIRKVNRLTI